MRDSLQAKLVGLTSCRGLVNRRGDDGAVEKAGEKKKNLYFPPIERNKNVTALCWCREALKGDKRVPESLGGKERTLCRPASCFHSWFAGSGPGIAHAVQFGLQLAEARWRSWPWQQAGCCAQGLSLPPYIPAFAGVPHGDSSTSSKDPTSSRRADVPVHGVGC